MKPSSIACLVVLIVGLAAPLASAQSAYVGASVLADVVRTSGPLDQLGNGEALGAALRVGASLGEHWGVELEFTRSGDIEWRPDVSILARATPTFTQVIGVLPDIAIFPTPEISIETQLSTLGTTVWWRQKVSDRFSLVYLGGAAFARTRSETSVGYPRLTTPLGGQTLPTGLFTQETVSYDTGVNVGLEGQIGMTDHLHLVPGLRLVSVSSRWIIRPAVGLHWQF